MAEYPVKSISQSTYGRMERSFDHTHELCVLCLGRAGMGRVECVSLDAERGDTLGKTTCQISKPILKGNTQVVFDITYSINKESTLGQNVTFAAEVTSGNDKHSINSEFKKQKTIDVKYAIYIALIRHESSTIHINFTSGKRDLMKPVQQIIRVQNDLRELIFKVFIRVPVKLGDN
ncbi:integrin alpha-D-like [Megalobrama amblycephala]|uniref:integrin alpha-D-like n=1 Tax=Megalobrama amblycephala TaxID=75352 RepID=UPI00201455E6|nr:integrin alpha-D-like [Megalobrama amblycephala]